MALGHEKTSSAAEASRSQCVPTRVNPIVSSLIKNFLSLVLPIFSFPIQPFLGKMCSVTLTRNVWPPAIH